MNLPANLPEWIYLVGLIVPAFTAWVTVRFTRRDSPAIRRIDEQVSNTHPTNLRDDMDDMHGDIRDIHKIVNELSTTVTEVHTRQLRLERRFGEHLGGDAE